LDWPATVSNSFAVPMMTLPGAGCCREECERSVNLPMAAAPGVLVLACRNCAQVVVEILVKE
jgi:hypothetical protein